jgi:hypothetical protein
LRPQVAAAAHVVLPAPHSQLPSAAAGSNVRVMHSGRVSACCSSNASTALQAAAAGAACRSSSRSNKQLQQCSSKPAAASSKQRQHIAASSSKSKSSSLVSSGRRSQCVVSVKLGPEKLLILELGSKLKPNSQVCDMCTFFCVEVFQASSLPLLAQTAGKMSWSHVTTAFLSSSSPSLSSLCV